MTYDKKYLTNELPMHTRVCTLSMYVGSYNLNFSIETILTISQVQILHQFYFDRAICTSITVAA